MNRNRQMIIFFFVCLFTWFCQSTMSVAAKITGVLLSYLVKTTHHPLRFIIICRLMYNYNYLRFSLQIDFGVLCCVEFLSCFRFGFARSIHLVDFNFEHQWGVCRDTWRRAPFAVRQIVGDVQLPLVS